MAPTLVLRSGSAKTFVPLPNTARKHLKNNNAQKLFIQLPVPYFSQMPSFKIKIEKYQYRHHCSRYPSDGNCTFSLEMVPIYRTRILHQQVSGQTVFRIRIQPGSADPDWEYGSGTRQAKIQTVPQKGKN
jgi:hypothetical protein